LLEEIPGILNICADREPSPAVPSTPMPLPSRQLLLESCHRAFRTAPALRHSPRQPFRVRGADRLGFLAPGNEWLRQLGKLVRIWRWTAQVTSLRHLGGGPAVYDLLARPGKGISADRVFGDHRQPVEATPHVARHRACSAPCKAPRRSGALASAV
jgi:hypothetical protein